MLNMLFQSLLAIGASIGFGIIFNIRGKNLFFASLCGGLSWMIYLIAIRFSFSITISLFIASIIMSIYSEIMARVIKTPVTAFVVCGMIPLVPGGGMYHTMYYSVMGNIDASLNTGFKTLSNAGAIAVGIVLVYSLSRLITYWKVNTNVILTNYKQED